jgi:hypothetical protein
MGQVKAYAEWAKNKGHLDKNYKPIDKSKGDMNWVNDYIKDRDLNMPSRHFTKLKTINQRRKHEIKSSKT